MLSLHLRLKQEVAELRQHATESEKELNEATAELSIAHDKVDGLKASLREAQSKSHADTTVGGGPDDLEVEFIDKGSRGCPGRCLRVLGPFTVGDG